jgi:DNA-binding MarR family transcriptional regulator
MAQKSIPTLECMCASFRRASRALTQNYDDALRPLGLRATQFTVLQALSQTGEISQGKLGEILAIDSTTLTRTLEIMLRGGWIAKRRGRDKRERLLRLASTGKVLLKKATPPWKETQARLRRLLGDERWGTLLNLTNEVTATVTE